MSRFILGVSWCPLCKSRKLIRQHSSYFVSENFCQINSDYSKFAKEFRNFFKTKRSGSLILSFDGLFPKTQSQKIIIPQTSTAG